MALLEVTCVNHRPSDNTHQGIITLGGRGWSHTRQEAVDNIMNGKHTYFINVDGLRSFLRVIHDQKNPFVQAHHGGVLNDNLLHLGECAIDA